MTYWQTAHLLEWFPFNRNSPPTSWYQPYAQLGYIIKWKVEALPLWLLRDVSRGQSSAAGKGDGEARRQCRAPGSLQLFFLWANTLSIPKPQKQLCKHQDDKLSLLCPSYSCDHSAVCVTVTGAHGHLPARLLASGECGCVWFTWGSSIVTSPALGPLLGYRHHVHISFNQPAVLCSMNWNYPHFTIRKLNPRKMKLLLLSYTADWWWH